MTTNRHLALCAPTGGWWACAHEGRIVIRNGESSLSVAVDGPLRWVRDDVEVSFEQALEAVPEALHGWMALAALIAVRHALGGLTLGVALPAGYHDWWLLARRAAPLQAWMHGLARLDAVDVPEVPPEVDDGLDGLGGSGAPPPL